MTSSEAITARHREALGGGWHIAQQFAELHGRAVKEFGLTVRHDGPCERSVMVLGNHAFNVYTAALDLIVRGQFDVAAYLSRALFDIPSLILATAVSEAFAKRFLPFGSGLRASDARRWVEAQGALAEAFSPEEGLHVYMNEQSHTNSYHAESLLDITDDGIVPTVGGRMDNLRARRDTAIVCGLEKYILETVSVGGGAGGERAMQRPASTVPG